MAPLRALVLLSSLAFSHLAAAQCNADNVLRALRRAGEPASSFCLSLFGIPAVTVVPPPTATTEPVFPPFVSAFPASRVFSACSCFLGATATTTITPTKTTTVLSTLTGFCATNPRTYEGAYGFVPRPTQTVVNNSVAPSDAHACCSSCRAYPSANPNGICLAYYDVPGETCNLLTVNGGIGCGNPPNDVVIKVDKGRFPNQLGGAGLCADGVEVVG